MNCFLTASLILSIITALFSVTRQFQMLQQNSYFPSRYTLWLKSNFPVLPALAFFVSSVLFLAKLYFIQSLFLLAVTVISVIKSINTQKKSIKKLVFTSRVKRLYTASVLVMLILLAAYIIFSQYSFSKGFAILIFLLSFIPCVLTYTVWGLTYPVEKAVTRFYINDAKKILKSYNDLKVIGITGSYGKTTTKFILTRILNEKYNVVCTPQSFNTPMGVVRTVREKLLPQTNVFVCEMGAKNIGDIKEICDIVNPDLGVITSVGSQHLETFKSVDNVFKTKFELADAVFGNNGRVFVNGDSAEIADRIKGDEFIVYGTGENSFYTAKNISYGRNGSEFDIELGGETVHLTSRLLGLHSIINIAGAAALAYELGVAAKDIKFAVASLKPTEHRLELKGSINDSLMIDDAYNANPEGCLEAVRVLGSFDGMRKVIITPGLIELGDKEYECNFRLGLETASQCDIIIFVGINRSKPMVDAVNTTEFDKSKMFVAASFKEAMGIYAKYADNNTVLLIENDLPDNYLN